MVHYKGKKLIEIKKWDQQEGFILHGTPDNVFACYNRLERKDQKEKSEPFYQMLVDTLHHQNEPFFLTEYRGKKITLAPHGEKAEQLWTLVDDINPLYFKFTGLNKKTGMINQGEFVLKLPFLSAIPMRFSWEKNHIQFFHRNSNEQDMFQTKEEVHSFYERLLTKNQEMEQFLRLIKSDLQNIDSNSTLNISNQNIYFLGELKHFMIERKEIAETSYYLFDWGGAWGGKTFRETNLDVLREKINAYFLNEYNLQKQSPTKRFLGSPYQKFLVDILGTTTMRTGYMENQFSKEEFMTLLEEGYGESDIIFYTKEEYKKFLNLYRHRYMKDILHVISFKNVMLFVFYSGPYPFLEMYEKKH